MPLFFSHVGVEGKTQLLSFLRYKVPCCEQGHKIMEVLLRFVYYDDGVGDNEACWSDNGQLTSNIGRENRQIMVRLENTIVILIIT